MEGRSYEGDTNLRYRFGFNGKENDDVVKGDGNQQDYGMRIYDLKLGRFLTVDPLTKDFAMLTPYQFASNTPISSIDLDGLEAVYYFNSDIEKYSGFEQAIQILTQTNILSDLKREFSKSNAGIDIYYVVSDKMQSATTKGETNLYYNKNKELLITQFNTFYASENGISEGMSKTILDQSINKGKGAIIIEMNKSMLIESELNPKLLKELTLTVVHEFDAHALDDKDGKNDTPTDKDHEAFFNDKTLLGTPYSIPYDKIKSDSKAGKYKNKIEKAFESMENEKPINEGRKCEIKEWFDE